MAELRLIIFDVDGTLVDSQGEIAAAMAMAFDAEGLPGPAHTDVLSIIGLSLDQAFIQLSPEAEPVQRQRLVAHYKAAFQDLRASDREMGQLFPGAMDALMRFKNEDETLLAIATGKSRRGLDKVLAQHELTGLFHSEQVSDHHPSKPNPSMILTALKETGVEPDSAVMVGDTTFDMQMARSAGVKSIGVSWGYHAAESLNADLLIAEFATLPAAVDKLIGN